MFSNSGTLLNVELQPLVVGYRPGADAADRSLDVLGPDRIDDITGGEPEARQAVGPDPGPHGVVLRAPQRGVSHAGRALDLVEEIDRDVIRDEQGIMRVLGGIDGDHREQRRGFLLDRDALAARLLRQAGEGDLDPVVDVDGVDIGVGTELE
jgi:hypothetical protein